MTFKATLASRFAAAGLMACPFAMHADMAIWTNATYNTLYWTNTTHWVDENGDNLAEPPTNHTHDVVLAPLDHFNYQEIRWTTPPWQATLAFQDFGMLSLSENLTETAPYSHRIINIYNSDWNSHYREYGVTVTVDDPDGYKGLWKTLNGRVGFVLPATDVKSPTLSNVSVAKRVSFNVPSADTKAYLESAYDRGVLEKKGAGELHVKATCGADSTAYVAGGTLTLEGRPSGVAMDELPVPGAYMHFDASRTDTMKTYVGADGRTYVTNWTDISGNGAYAYFDAKWKRRDDQTHLTTNSCAPFLNGDLVDGMTVLDFGRSNWSQDESLGPVGCWLRISEEKTIIREVFYIGQYVSSGINCPIPGGYGAYNFHRAGNSLVANYDPTLPVRYGDILYDGIPGRNDSGFSPTSFSVVGVGSSANVAVGAICCDRMYMDRTGGGRVGELILYTNVLTHVQRVQISNYLMRKWKKAEKSDVGVAMVTSAATAIGVPEGRVAKIQEVGAFDGTLVKKGGGTLEVGSVATFGGQTLPTVDVQDGNIAFEALGTETDSPAADPYLWLDASVEASFVFTNKENDVTNYVAEWHDRRPGQTSVYAKLPIGTYDYKDGLFPARLENVVGDKAVVDFGTPGVRAPRKNGVDGEWSGGNPSFLNLSVGDVQKSYDSFVVTRSTSADSLGRNLFGSSSIQMLRSNNSTLLKEDYGGYACYGALWTIDGVPVDPLLPNGGKFNVGDWIVASVSSSGKTTVNLIGGKDRYSQGMAWGGVQVAEHLIYDRVLTPEERRQTIAYLMKKWKGEDAPGVGPTRLAAMKFANGIPAVMDSSAGTEVEIGSVSGGDGSLLKKGAGAVTVPITDENGMTDIAVSEGTLDLSFNFIDESVFHFDASDVDSLSYYVTDNGTKTNVTSVADVRRNGIAATSWMNINYTVDGTNRAISVTNPVWRAIAMPDGTARPAFDFGRMRNYHNRSDLYEDSSAFNISTRFTNIREMHAIFSDNEAGDHEIIFSDTSSYDYLRNGEMLLYIHNTYTKPHVTNGYIAVNGEVVAPNYPLPSGFHLVSMAPTANTAVGSIGHDRNINAGGCYISEYIGFTNHLSAAKRKYLQDMLMHKWFGREKPVWPEAYASISVAAGATLNIAGDPILSVAKIGGGGTVTGGSFADVSEMEVACSGGATEPFSLSGGMAFAQSVTVTLAGEPGTLVSGGTYPLVNASSLAGLENAAWTVEGLPARQRYKVSASGGTLQLTLLPAGTSVILR